MTQVAASSSSVASHFFFRSKTLEGMHQFHLNFTKESGIIKYRSSLIRGVIRKMLTEVWPFLTYILAKLSI